MKTLTLVLSLFVFTAHSQTINVELDTTQALQNSDAGSVAYADVDQDGDYDLLITGNGPTVGVSATLYENDGNGNFTVMSQPAIVQVFAGAAEFADVDNDGDMDLLMTGNTSSPTATANLYINDGTGNFSLATGTPFEASNGGDIDFGDVDGDNDIDLIMTGFDASGDVFSKLYLNNGMGSFSVANGTSFTAVSKSAVEFIDIDNDNDLDVLICGSDVTDEPTTKLYANNGAGLFSEVSGVPFENVEFGDIAFGDTDNDGDQDILLTGMNANNENIAQLYLNSGSSFSLLPNTPFTGVSLHSSAFADFNNDGDVDLLHLGSSSSGLIGYIYENQGSNNFILADSSLSGSYNGNNIVADLNGDNKLDIVTTGTSFTAPFRAPKIYFNKTLNLSVKESALENLQWRIYPNPSHGIIHIETNSASQADMEVYDLTGRLIRKDSFVKTLRDFTINQPSGVYLVRLTIDKQVYTERILLKR